MRRPVPREGILSRTKIGLGDQGIVLKALSILITLLFLFDGKAFGQQPRQPARPPVLPARPSQPGARLPTPKVAPVAPKQQSFLSQVKAIFRKGPSSSSKKTPPTLIGKENVFGESSSPISTKYPLGREAVFAALPDLRSETPSGGREVTPAASKYSNPGGRDRIFQALPDTSKGPPPSIANTPSRIFQPLPQRPNLAGAQNIGVVAPKGTPLLAVRGPGPTVARPYIGNLPPPRTPGNSKIIYEQLPPSTPVYSKLPESARPVRPIKQGDMNGELRKLLEQVPSPANASRPEKPPLPKFLQNQARPPKPEK